MKNSRLKYFLSCLMFVTFYNLKAQQNMDDNQPQQALIMIVGDPLQTNNNNNNDFINTNPYNQTNAPPVQNYSSGNSNTIEPTLENGFHMRFEVGSSQSVERIGSMTYAPSSGYSSGKTRKSSHPLSQTTFNIKKRIKAWMPKHKKKYRPHLCGRF